jgi:cytochrome P450
LTATVRRAKQKHPDSALKRLRTRLIDTASRPRSNASGINSAVSMSDTISTSPASSILQTRRLPPTPPGSLLLGNTLQYLRDPLTHVTHWARDYGDVVRLRLPGMRTYLAVHPEHVEYVLRGNYRNFIKDKITRRLSLFLGQGLLTSEGEFWRRQRRLSQPAFQQQQVEQYAGMMVALAGRMLQEWRDGDVRDIHAEMMQLTLAIVAKTLFDADVSSTARDIGQSLDVIMDYFLTRP